MQNKQDPPTPWEESGDLWNMSGRHHLESSRENRSCQTEYDISRVSIHFSVPELTPRMQGFSPQCWGLSVCGGQRAQPHLLSVQTFQWAFSPMHLGKGNPSDWLHSPWGACLKGVRIQKYMKALQRARTFSYTFVIREKRHQFRED